MFAEIQRVRTAVSVMTSRTCRTCGASATLDTPGSTVKRRVGIAIIFMLFVPLNVINTYIYN